MLEGAELYWLTTVRADGRPHVTPLIGVWHDGAVHFCTGPREQKARNLETQPPRRADDRQQHVGPGPRRGRRGHRGARRRARGAAAARRRLRGEVRQRWHFDVGDGVFGHGEHAAAVFRIEPAKVLAFAKEPHAQTRYRFTSS